ncbi:MAG: hypothetical protein MZW92_62255 [Comamonadaceae bacterium]|nr:hypothetical protein [Comamonadaceae bacterium]
MISAIAFATVLGTVSGLIIAASGAVAHDLLDRFGKVIKNDKQKVNAGKIVAFAVGGAGHRPGDHLQGRQRHLPGRPGLRRGGLGQPALDRHDALLEADDRPGHHRLDLRRRHLVDRPDPVLADDVRALRQGPAHGAVPPEESRASSRSR